MDPLKVNMHDAYIFRAGWTSTVSGGGGSLGVRVLLFDGKGAFIMAEGKSCFRLCTLGLEGLPWNVHWHYEPPRTMLLLYLCTTSNIHHGKDGTDRLCTYTTGVCHID